MKIENVAFIDFPHPVPSTEYDRTERECVQYFCRHPAVVAIYKLGGINDPGISDLDLLLVLRENGVLQPGDCEFLAGLDEYICVHPPFVVPETLFPYINYLYFASNLRHLAGEMYSMAPCASETEHAQMMWLLCAEASLSRLCDIVYQITWRTKISIRRMLLKLNSIKHDVHLLGQIYGTAGSAKLRGFVGQISELRKSWFSCDETVQVQETVKAVSEGITVLSEIMDSLASLARTVFGLTANERIDACALFPDSLQVLKFQSGTKTSVEAIANPLALLRNSGGRHGARITRHVNDVSVITLPVELLFTFLPVPPEQSSTAAHIRDCVTIRGEGQLSQWQSGHYSELLRKRYQIVDLYNRTIAGTNASSMSLLLMAPWLTTQKARFHGSKRLVLKSALKLRLL